MVAHHNGAVHEPEILEREIAPSLPAQAGGTVDIQVATARRFPRSITKFIQTAQELATLTPDIAASCVYALPRGGKTIEGPSARLAEIVAHAWGNLRIQAGATDHDDRYITARGEAWDVESNTAIGFEVRRRITNKRGETYDDDMITVTGNAAASIALRNAVFKAVPSSFWRPIYQKCRQVIAGDAKTFAARRDEMLKAFMVAGVTPDQLCAGIGLKGVPDITLEHMTTLVGILNAIKDGETTIEEAFPEGGGLGSPQPAQRKSQQQNGGEGSQQREARSREMPSAATGPVGGSTPPASQQPPSAPASTHAPPAQAPAGSPAYVGTIAALDEQPGGTLVTLNTGFRAATKNPDVIAALKQLRDAGTLIELGTRASAKNPKNAPIITEIQPVVAE